MRPGKSLTMCLWGLGEGFFGIAIPLGKCNDRCTAPCRIFGSKIFESLTGIGAAEVVEAATRVYGRDHYVMRERVSVRCTIVEYLEQHT